MSFEHTSIRALLFVGIFSCILFILFILFLLFISTYIKQPEPVVFDIKRTYKAFVRQAASADISSIRLKTLGRTFPIILRRVTDDYAKEKGVIIYAKDSVISGARDVTADIQLLIAREMAHLKRNDPPIDRKNKM